MLLARDVTEARKKKAVGENQYHDLLVMIVQGSEVIRASPSWGESSHRTRLNRLLRISEAQKILPTANPTAKTLTHGPTSDETWTDTDNEEVTAHADPFLSGNKHDVG